jgi:hypothetical protein
MYGYGAYACTKPVLLLADQPVNCKDNLCFFLFLQGQGYVGGECFIDKRQRHVCYASARSVLGQISPANLSINPFLLWLAGMEITMPGNTSMTRCTGMVCTRLPTGTSTRGLGMRDGNRVWGSTHSGTGRPGLVIGTGGRLRLGALRLRTRGPRIQSTIAKSCTPFRYVSACGKAVG